MNTTELIKKATEGKLTQKESNEIAIYLKDRELSDYKKYDLILALGKANAIEHEDVVSAYLNYERDPMISKLALQVLCDYWNLSAKYLSQLKLFCLKVDWDTEDDVRMVALTSAGEYLRSYESRELLKIVMDTFEKEEDQIVKNAAYIAMARAIGREWSSIPSPLNLANGQARIDMTILSVVRKKLGWQY